MIEDDKMTGKAMCEYISSALWDRYGVEMSPEQIWASSPSGELFYVVEGYREARAWRENGHYELDLEGPAGQLIFVHNH